MINVADLHDKIAAAGIPIHGVSYHRENGVRIDFKDDVTEAQRAAAKAIVDAYDQSVEDAKREALKQEQTAIVEALPSKGDVSKVKSVEELAAMVEKQSELMKLIAEKLGLT